MRGADGLIYPVHAKLSRQRRHHPLNVENGSSTIRPILEIHRCSAPLDRLIAGVVIEGEWEWEYKRWERGEVVEYEKWMGSSARIQRSLQDVLALMKGAGEKNDSEYHDLLR